MLEAKDLKAAQDPKAPIKKAIRQISQEIAIIHNRINVPSNFKGLVSGAGLGHAIGKMGGLAIGAGIGYILGNNYQLAEEDKQILRRKLAQLVNKRNQLVQALKTGAAPGQGPKGGTMSAADLSKLQYETYDFKGPWFDLFGKPARPFHCMVFGRPKQGKSIFSFQFANYLSKFGKVLYIASEEGYGGTLKKKITDFGLENNEKVSFSDAKSIDEMRKVIPGYDFVFIDSVNFSHLEVEDVEALKAENPGTSFITIQQATKGGQFRGSQEYAHNCDMIVEVIAGVGYQTGRFQAASEYAIFTEPEESAQEKESKKKKNQQLEIFDI